MASELRKSGIRIIGDVKWGTHFCQFYKARADLVDILVPYFKAGLKNNEFCVWVTSEPLTVQDAAKALTDALPETPHYIEKNQLEIISYDVGFLKDGVFDAKSVLQGWIDKMEAATGEGYEGLRLSCNLSWVGKKRWEKFTAYSSALDAVVGHYRILALCSFDLKKCRQQELIDVVNNHAFSLFNHRGEWIVMESIKRRETEKALEESEDQVRRKLESVYSEKEGFAELELADMFDLKSLQGLIDDFHAVVRIPMGLFDRKGNCLASAGWSDICTNFHRVDARMQAFCRESDTKLSAGLKAGEHRLYKCKNNMWDLSTPLMIGGAHIGNVFFGQFFFDDETPDYGLFREQARQYGFDEEKYLAALDAVPRLSRKSLESAVRFLMKFTQMMSRLGYSNLRLARVLAEHKRIESRLKWLATFPARNPNPVIEADLTGKIHYANPAALKFFPGLEKEGLLYLQKDIRPMADALKKNSKQQYIQEVEREGECFQLSYSYYPEIDRIRIYLLNVTERKRAEEELAKLVRVKTAEVLAHEQEMAVVARHALMGEFSSAIAHEINQPLTAILSNSQAMKRFLSEKDFDLAEIREITGDIIKDSTRAGEVIRKLRLLLNKGELKLQRVDICEIINETAAFVKNELALDKIELSLSCAGPQYVMADQIQLQQVMLNLIRNACDALESCPRKKIHITSEGTTPDKVLIAVRDSGKGFKEKDIELVFKPFYTSKETGMGMGLAISKRIIEAHGGRMWARNHPRGGAVVFIELQKTTGEQKT